MDNKYKGSFVALITPFVNGKIKWFSGGKLNASYNCLDRHVNNGNGDKTAIIWEGDDPAKVKKISYKENLKFKA